MTNMDRTDDSLDTSGEEDLSKSFIDILSARRAEIASSASKMKTTVSSESQMDGYETAQSGVDLATISVDESLPINRFMRDLRLNNSNAPLNAGSQHDQDDDDDAAELLERFSPIKMIGLLRPSTVYEEDSLCSVDPSAATAAGATQTESDVTSGETVIRRISSATTNTATTHTAMSSDSIELSSIATADFSRDSLAVSSERKSVGGALLDDTLEVVEYVPCEDSSKYLLQPVRRQSSVDDDNAVVTIDSSPELSYKTAQTHVNTTTISEIQTNDTNVFPVKKNRSFFDDSFGQCVSFTTNHRSMIPTPAAKADVINLSSSDSDENGDNDMPPPPEQRQPTEHTLNDVSSIMTDDTAHQSDYGSMPDVFNDSLERVEYMMAEGRRILAEKKIAAEQATKMQTVVTPVSNVVPAILRQQNTNSPKELFKKPTFNCITPGLAKRPPPAATSSSSVPRMKCRIPKPVSATKGAAGFKHIKSPIGIYMKNRPPTTMVVNVTPSKDFFDSSYVGSLSKNDLDFTVFESSAEQRRSPAILPQKAYFSAAGTLVNIFVLFLVTI